MTYVSGLIEDLLVPAMIMFNNPFGEAKLTRAAVDLDIEPVSHSASIDRLQLSRLVYKPGDTVSVRVRWRHERRQPT